MLINVTLLIAIAICIALPVVYFIFRIFWKRKKKAAAFITAGLAGTFIITGIIMMNSRVYIVHAKNDYTYYAVYGSPEYKLRNGKTISLDLKMQHVLVVNNSKEQMVIEFVVYGYGRSTDVLMEPGDTYEFEHGLTSIDYFFDNKPPRQIETKKRGNVVKYWLRTKKDYDVDHPYSIDSDKLDQLREKLKALKNTDSVEEEEMEEEE
ncbi:MAG TPA: hypothetical protein VD905_21615 [Flavobacteriales bacterium]|nr:hypothetical protein [Flavobacteriales bacterium]